MKQFFILGRNPELSRAEIVLYLESRGVEFEQVLFEGNYLILELDDAFVLDIQEFGGLMKAGKISFDGDEKEFAEFVEKDALVQSDKFSYAVFGNYDFVDLVKDKFKSEKRKAMLRHGRSRIKFQDDEVGNIANADFYLFGAVSEGKVYFGVIKKEYDYSGVKKRDMEKPNRREELAISPRLSKILVNLSGVRRDENLLDCFCGVGGVLGEALIRGINVVGVDKDKEAIQQASENLDWLRESFGFSSKYELVIQDSASFKPYQLVDGVATEAPLGEVLKHRVGKKEADKFIKQFEGFIVPVLKNLKKMKKPDARIAITFPVVGDFHVDISGISRKSGLKVYRGVGGGGVKFPILESRKDQFVSRDFVVFS